MIKRIGLGIVVVAALILTLFYSQIRVSQPFVSGIVETDEIRLGSRVGGRIKQVHVEEGDRVTAGQQLIDFEAYDLLERELQAIAELAIREANLKRFNSGLRPEEIAQAKTRVDQLSAQLKLLELGPRQEELEAARERLNGANAELLLVKREYERAAKLAQTDAIARGELDIAVKKLDAATANVEVKKNELAILNAGNRPEEIDQARARLEESKLGWELAKKGFRIEEIEQAEAARDSASAALEAIRQQKTELTIVAPSDGFVDALDLQAGDLVPPNAPVMTILSDSRKWVRAYVPQRFLQLEVGQELRVSIDSFPDDQFRGVVSFISHQAEFTPSNVQTADDRAKQVYRIRVTIDEGAEKLRSGMTANVWLNSLGGAD